MQRILASIIAIALAFAATIAVPADAKSSGKSGKSSRVTETSRPKQHAAQGTGNFKGKRDRHQKAGPQHEKKKQKLGWLPLRKGSK